MRQFILPDLLMAGRAIYGLSKTERQAALSDMFHHAHVADKFRKKFGRNHPKFGNGSLSSICSDAALRVDYALSDRHFRECLRDVLDMVDATRHL